MLTVTAYSSKNAPISWSLGLWDEQILIGYPCRLMTVFIMRDIAVIGAPSMKSGAIMIDA
jgi:hypothetical protein